MNSVVFKPAQPADAEILWSIRSQAINELCAEFYPSQTLSRWAQIEMPSSFVSCLVAESAVVALVGDHPVGFALMDKELGTLDAQFVDPIFCGLGVGTSLLLRIEQLAQRHGFSKLKLSASLNAVEFYRSRGYCGNEQSQTRQFDGISLASVLMERVIPNSESNSHAA